MTVGSHSSFMPIRSRLWNTAETRGFSSGSRVSFSMSEARMTAWRGVIPISAARRRASGPKTSLNWATMLDRISAGRRALRQAVGLRVKISFEVGGGRIEQGDIRRVLESRFELFPRSERGGQKTSNVSAAVSPSATVTGWR